jgi:hypothetical protein
MAAVSSGSAGFSFFEFVFAFAIAVGSIFSDSCNCDIACSEYGSFNDLGSIFNRVTAEVGSSFDIEVASGIDCRTVDDGSGSGSANTDGLVIRLGEDSISCWPTFMVLGFSMLFHAANSL